MIYKFRSKSTGDLIMMGPNGDQMLHILGREPAAQGIIDVEAMPEVLAKLKAAVEADDAARAAAAESDDVPLPEGIALHRRLWPMIQMIEASLAEGHPIVWGV
jgi:hypothetical protein